LPKAVNYEKVNELYHVIYENYQMENNIVNRAMNQYWNYNK